MLVCVCVCVCREWVTHLIILECKAHTLLFFQMYAALLFKQQVLSCEKYMLDHSLWVKKGSW